ncbi:MAG: tRNA lysidine(34) synthetase TilS [Candidatus Omnitrophica bacterium]|nr:tRNA lysidine(34) synthetase TilS [Candidatus Omnitrophota bacterium]
MFLDTVRSTIERHRMLRAGDRVLIGVSGGPDSLALLAALVSLRDRFRVALQAAYVDHGLRPAAARREAALVQATCRRWGVPAHRIRRSVRKRGGESPEAAAREARYEALTLLARRHRCGTIALGHTRDDQAETVLMWLIRGAGTTGLAGIPPVRRMEGMKIVRPLIRSSRAEGIAYLKGHGIRPLKDRTNNSPRYLRNRIRHELIPLLESRYNPQVRERLSGLAEILREDLDWMSGQLQARFRQVARLGKGWVRIDRRRLRRDPTALRRGVLRLALARLQGNLQGFSSRHWGTLEALLCDSNGGPTGVDLPHRVRAELLEERWLLVRQSGTLRTGES